MMSPHSAAKFGCYVKRANALWNVGLLAPAAAIADLLAGMEKQCRL